MSDKGYQPTIVEGLLSAVNIFLLLFISSIRARLKEKVTTEVCQLKREKDQEVIKTLTGSLAKIEAHVEEIFVQNQAININLAELNGKIESRRK